jgi:UDP-glucose 4-epimerase
VLNDHRAHYRGRRVLVTGGLGFIGSHVARHLVDLGAVVTIVDALIPDTGADRRNVAGLEADVHIHVADMRDRPRLDAIVRDSEVIFNLAGQVSHLDSMVDPQRDLELNCGAQLSLLEACRRHNPAARIVFAGTRQIYGRPVRLPVDEHHQVRPTDVNGVNKAAAELYHLVYGDAFGLPTCSLRLTNVYGPHQRTRDARQGFIGWFVRLAVEDRDIPIYGDGSQQRDLVYVDDAVDAFLRAGASDAARGQVFNVGGLEAISLRDLARRLVEIAGGGRIRRVEWPPDHRAIDVGSVALDSSKLSASLGWVPRIDLTEGLRRTVASVRQRAALDLAAETEAD